MIKKIVVLNLIPIFVHLIFSFIWYFIGTFEGMLSLYESVLNIIVIPIYLIIVNKKVLRFNLLSIIIAELYMVLIVVVGAVIHFFNWWLPDVGIYGYNLKGVDTFTISFIEWEMILSACFVTLLWIIVNLVCFVGYNRKNNVKIEE